MRRPARVRDSSSTSSLTGRWRQRLFRMFRTMRRAQAGEEHAQIVVDLGERAHRRTRAGGERLLLDGDGRREPLDRIDLGPRQLVEELARLGGERFDVAPLSFGVERVEGERRLAGAGDARDDDQSMLGKIEIDVLEIVGTRAANTDEGHGEAAGKKARGAA